MTEPVYVAYSSNDFFWKSAGYTEDDMTQCASVNELKCSKITKKNQDLCEYKDVCANYKHSQILRGLQTQHTGSDTRLYDVQQEYYLQLWNTLHYGIGIVGVLGLIYIFRFRGATVLYHVDPFFVRK